MSIYPYKAIIAGMELSFPNEIFSVNEYKDISIVILKADSSLLDKSYNNVIAINNENGTIIWEIEEIPSIDFRNPYEGVYDAGSFFVFFKANSVKVCVNKNNGKIMRNLNLNNKGRPW